MKASVVLLAEPVHLERPVVAIVGMMGLDVRITADLARLASQRAAGKSAGNQVVCAGRAGVG